MLEQTGVAEQQQIKTVMPSEERLQKGPVAIFECFQKIPCNPCTEACARKAPRPMNDINDLPSVNYDQCNGCGLCISACPGLAIFVVDMTQGPHSALVKLPFEFRPLPEKDSMVTLLNREGQAVGHGRVQAVENRPNQNKTAVISVIVPKEIAMDVRAIAPMVHNHGEGAGHATGAVHAAAAFDHIKSNKDGGNGHG